MSFAKYYFRQRMGGILFLLLCCGVFLAAFLFYRLPLGAALYPSLLCGVFGAVFLGFDLVRTRKKHRQLTENLKSPSRPELSLPEAETVIEADYRELLLSLEEEKKRREADSARRFREMTDYYTVWVHQIKTPIASMGLTLQNEDTPLSRKLSLELLRIEQYVEMVLAYLRLDSDSSDYVFRECPLDPILRQSVAKFSSEFIYRKLRLIYEPVEETVVTDEKWLSFVVEQLLSNALKYTKEGSITISMRGKKTLCIEDTGVGIAPEDLPRVFEKGYTGCNGRRDKKASGLGLYLCRRICRSLGAEISIASQPGKGTAVSVCLEQYPLQGE